jgi:hypothetical protein
VQRGQVHVHLGGLVLGQRGLGVHPRHDRLGQPRNQIGFRVRWLGSGGAVSITGIKGDLPAWRIDELGQAVRRCADKVSESLGGSR